MSFGPGESSPDAIVLSFKECFGLAKTRLASQEIDGVRIITQHHRPFGFFLMVRWKGAQGAVGLDGQGLLDAAVWFNSYKRRLT